MDAILKFINDDINVIIIFVGIFVFAGLLVCAIVLTNERHMLEEMTAGKRVRTVVNPDTLAATQEHYTTVTREDTDTRRQHFNRWCSYYSVFAGLIGILPLMGILGTVAGLILNVRAQDLEAVFASLNTALSSTLLALFFAIVLKIFDSFGTSRIIFQIDTLFDDYDRRFRDAIDMGNLGQRHE